MIDAHRRLVTLGSVVAGVVLAHVAGFLVAFPGGHERAAHLRATGHGYWDLAVAAAVVGGVAAVGLTFAVNRRRGARPDAGVTLARLAALQLVAYAGIETVERAASGVAPASLLESRAFVIGLVLQVVVAALAVALLSGVARVAVASARRRTFSRGRARFAAALIVVPASTRWRSDARPRAPPLAA